jgi:ATP-dependent Clp protease ATP-binding subunit ClpA
VDQKIYRTALEAARRRFSPEFMNRIDKVVVFRSLKEEHLRQILEIELKLIQQRITRSLAPKFVFTCTEAAKELLLREGTDYKYGARHLRRALERFLVFPLSNLVATRQIETGDVVLVDVDPKDPTRLIFVKEVGGALVGHPKSDESFPDALPTRERTRAASPLGTARSI